MPVLICPEIAGFEPSTEDGIEDHVAALGRVELRRVFEGWVVDDRRVAAVLELIEQLPDQRRLASAGVAHDEQVGRLDGTWNRERRLEADQLG